MYVIGTAGHVDHGKSTLIKALTGIDPDRWEEEQRREMTIDLGFAWLRMPGGREVSLIDVPGHERFIKNMLAGIGGIDAALLIVAADEAIMPQTIEHLAILDLLGVSHGIVVITKADLVEQEWLNFVSEEIHEHLAHTTFAKAPLVPVSARQEQGIDTLLHTIDQVLDQTPSRIIAQGAPYLPIDRAFTLSGFGTVVTGTLSGGPLHLGDEIEIVPLAMHGRVRGLQTHQQKREVAQPGARVAVNITGISHHDVARGHVLTMPGTLQPTNVLDVHVRLVSAALKPLQQNMAVDLFVGAAEVPCRATLLDQEELLPGASGWLQLRLEHAIAAVAGDRFILRLPSPSATIGGGTIIDTHPPRHRRFRPEVIQSLEALARGRPADLVQRALVDTKLHTWPTLVKASKLQEQNVLAGVQELLQQRTVMVLDPSGEIMTNLTTDTISLIGWVLHVDTWNSLNTNLTKTISQYHHRYPLRRGIPREELRSRLQLKNTELDVIMQQAISQQVVRVHDRSVYLSDHHPTLSDKQQQIVEQLMATMATSLYSPPTLSIEPELLGWLLDQNHLVRVSEDVLFAPEAYTEMVHWVHHQIDQTGGITVAQFRNHFQTSRKYALALLEYLDTCKITRREGDMRVLY
ncbi:MAG: selenocysteine-specific translation elongation factor [Chloroflexi bacterium AL-W]|nr:selenocysteine-specific translation elongation factor [Chloroflexi bacterium AL-N1]NOK67927.1 selenocysteine-specific translation elongation factor [Chloroflexi bacterium AL-N10]NOK73267.1 selenocysteine-specific translation elongation factor [Chloroflexi bacterium AL-N5]NOK83181.1 selenocysteine-specific translation elongation factor [Chloroflexi bacterium AL-W]NOK87598.1 selenocysteine-specific translation elongation factor [Chloroflexi bacterium AL-N15]